MPGNIVRAGLLAVLPFIAATQGVSEGRAAAPAVEIVGTEFRISRADGTVLHGPALLGAVLTVMGPAGPARVRIDAVERDAQDPEITLHVFSVWNEAAGTWNDLCQPNAAGERKGFPLRGAFDGTATYRPDAPGFSLTCIAGAQAKCVRWGYKPWKEDVGGIRMLDLYRACTRMTRADYCGDGKGTTRDGTPIDFYDKAGIQLPETPPAMPFEAAWGPEGAVCVRHTRIPENMTLDGLAIACPRLANALGEQCREDKPGALMFNRSRP